MNRYLLDVASQADSVRCALDGMLTAVSSGGWPELSSRRWSKVVFAGMGSSHFVCQGAVIYLNQRGIPSLVLSAGELLHYERGLIDAHTLLVLVSQSGESAEIVRLLEQLPAGIAVAAITNEPASTLAIRSRCMLPLGVEREQSVTTRTYMSSLIAVNLLARQLAGTWDRATFEADIADALTKLEQVLQDHGVRGQLDNFLAEARTPYVCLIGRGYSLSTVRAGALFIREVSKYPALDFDAAEFRHGPMEMIDANFTAVITAPAGRTSELNRRLALDIAVRGGRAVVITNEPGELRELGLEHPNLLVIRQPPVDEYMSALLDVVPVQWIANLLAERRQLEVGAFRWSSKVTGTE